MANGVVQDIKRALVTPPFTQVDNFESVFRRFYGQLSQQVQTMNNCFRQFHATVGAAATSLTVTFASIPSPGGTTTKLANYTDVNYTAVAIPTWNTTVYLNALTDLTPTSVKFTFGAASPGGGGTLLVLTCR
jgi:hypothetical protein